MMPVDTSAAGATVPAGRAGAGSGPASPPPPIPVSVLTGFLGSGKTTLLRGLLRQPAMAGTAVIINEFGAIGLDHELVEAIDGETTLLQGGCVCCTVRDDLSETLLGLLRKHRDGTIAPLKRVVIETTGLADPAPILQLLIRDADLAQCYVLDGVITTLDAVHGLAQLEAHPEALRQAALADRIVLTKTDLATFGARERFAARLALLNPHAVIATACEGDIEAERLLGAGSGELAALTARDTLARPGEAWLDGAPFCSPCADPECAHAPGTNHPDAGIRSHCLVFDEPFAWEVVSDWLGGLAFFHGERLLRLKGILDIEGEASPVAVHGVHHLFHRPTQLAGWSGRPRQSRLVFITQGLDPALLAPPFAIAGSSRAAA